MQKIIPCLWFEKDADIVARYYAGIFDGAKIKNTQTGMTGPGGGFSTAEIEIFGHEFFLLAAGTHFKPNPSISFFVNFDPSRDDGAEERLNQLWEKMSPGGKVLMELGAYPFSRRYGWIEDKYGVSWQLILSNPDGEERPVIVPSFLFVGAVAGKAESAALFYQSVFRESKPGIVARYPKGSKTDPEGTIMYSDFRIENQWFAAMDSAHPGHSFSFSEGVSLMIQCEDQAEVDYYAGRLSVAPEAEICGWLKDQYGVSWQVAPRKLLELQNHPDKAKVARMNQAMYQMKRLDLAALEKAFNGDI
jgi:predicted 3-demethylubiquinone-9 3-methyltransferase (glyoxalase superfamily)